MNKIDHYREAEELLRAIPQNESLDWQMRIIAEAQVHATLATARYDPLFDLELTRRL